MTASRPGSPTLYHSRQGADRHDLKDGYEPACLAALDSSNVQAYRIAIQNAVIASGGLDHWTGEQLAWHLIGNCDNDSKDDMTPEELVEFCRRVLAHADAKKASVADFG